jgi:hypothetical protein
MTAEMTVRRLHLWSGLIVLGIFLAGAFTGAGVYAWLRTPGAPPPPPHAGGVPPHLLELGLTPDQQQKAQAIFDKHRTDIEAALQLTFPRVRAVQAQMESELRAILTPAQARKLDEIQARRPPPPPGGPQNGPPGLGPPPGGAPPLVPP